jgi:hypothetical protein
LGFAKHWDFLFYSKDVASGCASSRSSFCSPVPESANLMAQKCSPYQHQWVNLQRLEISSLDEAWSIIF